MDYASNMLELIRRGLGSGASTNSLIATPTPATPVGSSLVVVGWFAGGALELTEYSALIHDYYVRESAAHSKSATRHDPVHLIVDTRLTNSRLNIQAFVRSVSQFNFYSELKRKPKKCKLNYEYMSYDAGDRWDCQAARIRARFSLPCGLSWLRMIWQRVHLAMESESAPFFIFLETV